MQSNSDRKVFCNMNFVFRVDSSSEIGFGHLMRCLVLAKELRSSGASIQFICRGHTGSGHDYIKKEGFHLHLLPGKKINAKSIAYKDWLGCSQFEDVSACNQVLAKLPKCHIIVDHYGIDIEWESRVNCETLTVLDDLAERFHHCTGVIDQSLIHTRKDYEALVGGDFEFWGGANILLRDEFRSSPAWKDPADGSLVLCMGGADPHGVTTRIIKALYDWVRKSPALQPIKKINVVVGSAFENVQELESYLSGLTIDVALHRNIQNVSALMVNSSLSILSCGTMILEACALGVPAIGIPLAENQKDTANFLQEKKAIIPLTNYSDLEREVIEKAVITLNDREKLNTLSQCSKVMVDKNAAKNIAEELINVCWQS